MKFLIVSQYYPPETGAPQNRLHDLAKRLQAKGVEVTVLTAMPNYPQNEIYKDYKGKFFCTEKIEGVKVVRSWIFVSGNKSVVSRLLNYFSFMLTSFWVGLFKVGKQDFILCESPPLFLGKTAVLLSWLKRAKLIFNVSDLWPESAEKLGIVSNRLLLKMASWLESFLYNQSWLITGQTQGIVNNISQRFPKKKTYWLPNGIDVDFFKDKHRELMFKPQLNITPASTVFVYAGLLGYAQGLQVVLKAAKQFKSEISIHFVIAGTGPEKEILTEYKVQNDLKQVHFLGNLQKDDIPVLLSEATAAIVPLKKLNLFKGAIPSKAYEAMAMGIPILLGVEGEAKKLFIEDGKGGLAFEPENADELVKQIQKLIVKPELAKELGENGKKYVRQNFNRQKIADEFYKLLVE